MEIVTCIYTQLEEVVCNQSYQDTKVDIQGVISDGQEAKRTHGDEVRGTSLKRGNRKNRKNYKDQLRSQKLRH